MTVYFTDNFENFPTNPLWAVTTAGGGTFAKSNEKAHGGDFSGKCSSILAASQAYALTTAITSCGLHHYQIWILIDSSYELNNYILIAELYTGSKFAEILGIKNINSEYHLQNASPTWVDVCTLTPDVWHKIDLYYYAAGTMRIYVDNIKQGNDWSTYGNPTSGITRNYLGDTSTTGGVNNGFVWYDDLIIDDDMTEPSAAQELFRNITDYIGTLDVKIKVKSAYKTFSEVSGLHDILLSKFKNVYKSFIDYLGSTDTVSTLVGFVKLIIRTVTEYFGMKESKLKIHNMFKSFTEKFGSLDSKINFVNRYRNFVDYLGSKDSISKFKKAFHIAVEYLGTVDLQLFREAWNALIKKMTIQPVILNLPPVILNSKIVLNTKKVIRWIKHIVQEEEE